MRRGDKHKILLTENQWAAEERKIQVEVRKQADRKWADSMKRLHQAAVASDWETMGQIYFEQALQRFNEDLPFQRLREEAAKAQLRAL